MQQHGKCLSFTFSLLLIQILAKAPSAIRMCKTDMDFNTMGLLFLWIDGWVGTASELWSVHMSKKWERNVKEGRKVALTFMAF